MKKIILSISILAGIHNICSAQVTPIVGQKPTAAVINYEFDKFIKLDKTTHDFGLIPQGPTATTNFTISNISQDSIFIENVQASCGCTVPDWTKTGIAPGKTGVIKAVYNTQGRPNSFNKTLTIKTNRGTKPVFITGNVEEIPAGSVPPAVSSMIRHN